MTQNTEEVGLDRKDLKIMALKESLSKVSEENADLRVELTIAVQQVQQLSAALQQSQEDEGVKENPVDVSQEED